MAGDLRSSSHTNRSPNPVGLRSMDTHDRAFHYGSQGPEIRDAGLRLQRNSDRCCLTPDGSGPRRARRESNDQSPPWSAAIMPGKFRQMMGAPNYRGS